MCEILFSVASVVIEYGKCEYKVKLEILIDESVYARPNLLWTYNGLAVVAIRFLKLWGFVQKNLSFVHCSIFPIRLALD